jgi:hypothetical protein
MQPAQGDFRTRNMADLPRNRSSRHLTEVALVMSTAASRGRRTLKRLSDVEAVAAAEGDRSKRR